MFQAQDWTHLEALEKFHGSSDRKKTPDFGSKR